MDYMYGVSKGVAVGALTVVAGSVGFTLSILSMAFSYILPGQTIAFAVEPIKSLPSPRRSDGTHDQSPRSSVGSYLSQSTLSDGPSPRVTFQDRLAIPPVSTIQLSLPRERSRSRTRSARVRSLSPIADASPIIPQAQPVIPQGPPQEKVASTSAVRLDSAVVDPLVPQKPCKKALRMLGKSLSSAKMDRRKKLERSVSSPVPALSATGKEKATVFSDGEGEGSVSPTSGRRREKKGFGLGLPERRKTMPPEAFEKTEEEEEEAQGERNLLRARSVDRCLNKKSRAPSLPPPLPQRTNPYQAPYFFPAPGSPEAEDYVQRVREERFRASKASDSSLRTYFHQRPATPSSARTPSPASVRSHLPPPGAATPPADGSGAASPRGFFKRGKSNA
ncbi:hypothetical protein OE88DRAFT_1640637 [Heliocybe sulcata]|uniref:Uncharacterized protein n=1 Tax=Heliocybe sulcata TaxID=5364 RepID=A0A5C3NKW8_9AGAM|nr:hypothetical protein OE88DRAFT_1640637 [Heliocybe sulcata]